MNPQIPPQAFSKIAPRERPAPRYVNNTYGNRGYRRRVLTPIPPSGPPENPFVYYDAAQVLGDILTDIGIDPDSVTYEEPVVIRGERFEDYDPSAELFS